MRRYIAEWKTFWTEHIPAMMETKAVPDGSSWGQFPSPKPNVGDSTATFEYNVYVYCFTPAALRGILFITGKSMAADDQCANFGPELSVLANSLKTKFDSGDVPFIYTLPGKELAPKLTQPTAITGKSTPVLISDWMDIGGTINAVRE